MLAFLKDYMVPNNIFILAESAALRAHWTCHSSPNQWWECTKFCIRNTDIIFILAESATLRARWTCNSSQIHTDAILWYGLRIMEIFAVAGKEEKLLSIYKTLFFQNSTCVSNQYVIACVTVIYFVAYKISIYIS